MWLCKTCRKNNRKCDIMVNTNCYEEKFSYKVHKKLRKFKFNLSKHMYIFYIKWVRGECRNLCSLCDYKHECFEQFEYEHFR